MIPQEREFDVTQFKQDRQAYAEWFRAKFSADDEENAAQNLSKMIYAAIRYELTDLQRAYFTSYYLEGLTMEEIGETYGVNKSTVSRTVKRSRNRIERVLKYSSPKFMQIWERGDIVKVQRRNRRGRARFGRSEYQ